MINSFMFIFAVSAVKVMHSVNDVAQIDDLLVHSNYICHMIDCFHQSINAEIM
jgi:hypothetical protein